MSYRPDKTHPACHSVPLAKLVPWLPAIVVWFIGCGTEQSASKVVLISATMPPKGTISKDTALLPDQDGEDNTMGSTSSGRIVFASTRNGTRDIYSMNADGTDQNRLTDTDDNDYEPCWSPDGQQIAFAREGHRRDPTRRSDNITEIFVMNANGSEVRQLTDHGSVTGGPAWSWDGKYIAYHKWDRDNWEIYIVCVRGNKPRNLTNSPYTETYPHWHPDDKQLAFHYKAHDDWNIAVINRDGSRRRQLTSNPTEDWLPTWSPDGSKIAFWSTRTGDWEVFLMKPDGSDQKQISRESGQVNYWISRAAWSPDGQSLAIATRRKGGSIEIVRIAKNGGEATRLTTASGPDIDPDWMRQVKHGQ